MARTVDLEVQQAKRDAFLDVAQRLIQVRGYEEMSIQDVLDELESSRGALYHYFASKQDLLDGVVERFADAAMAEVGPILDDNSQPALRKLEQFLSGIARFKAERKELVLAIMKVWMSDGNALVRERLRQMSARQLGPILAAVIRQGVEEGVISSSAPEESARVILYLLQGYQELAAEHFVARQAGTISFAEVRRTYAAFTDAFERVLGIASGSVKLVDDETLRFWFG
jgi:AcrR family transcriptional regulator